MTRVIKNWEELSKLEPNNKYRIIVDLEYCCGWIVPIIDEPVDNGDRFKCNCHNDDDFYKHHFYLSTHTFYGKTGTPNILKEYGWDVELDNWDKVIKDDKRNV